MNIDNIINLINSHAPMPVIWVLSGLGALVCLGTAYVAMTPTKNDDQWLQKMEEKAVVGQVLKVLKSFSPLERKDKK